MEKIVKPEFCRNQGNSIYSKQRRPCLAVGAVQGRKLRSKFQFFVEANAVVLLQKYVRISESTVNAEKTVLRQEMFGTGQNVSTMI